MPSTGASNAYLTSNDRLDTHQYSINFLDEEASVMVKYSRQGEPLVIPAGWRQDNVFVVSPTICQDEPLDIPIDRSP